MEVGIRAIPYNFKMRQARWRQGLTQGKLGELVGLSQATISSVERLCCRVNQEQAEEIALVLGIHIDDLFPPETRNLRYRSGASIEFCIEVESLDALEPTELAELTTAGDLENALMVKQLRAVFGRLFLGLSPHEEKVIRRYFGFDGPPQTLEEIGRSWGNVTRERVRCVKDRGLAKLRHPSRSRQLRDFLEN